MKKGVCTLLALLLIFVSSAVFAAEDVQSNLTLPRTDKQKAGDSYGMDLNVVMPAEYKTDLKTFSLSFMVDKTIHIDKATFVGGLTDNDYRLMSTETDSSKQEIVTLVIPEVKALSRRDFTLKMHGTFKKGVKNVDKVAMSYVIAVVDKNGKTKSLQKNVASETGQAAPLDPVGGKSSVDPIAAGANTLTGSAPANAEVKVFRGKTLIGTTSAAKDGRFSVVINPQPEGARLSFTIRTKAGEEVIEATVGETSKDTPRETSSDKKKIDDYLRVLTAVNMNGREKLDQLQVNAAVAIGQFILAKDDASMQEITGAEESLAGAVKVARPAYISGYPDGTFKPTKAMTRAEVSAVFTRVANGGKAVAGFTSFRDVDDSQWFASSVGYMEKRGLISGYQDGSFKPHQSITRAEFARILASYAGLSPAQKTTFTDVKSNHWAKGYIGAVQEAGLMSGTGKGRFAPAAKITRQEVCAAMNKVADRKADKEFLDTYGNNPFKDVNRGMWSYYEIMEATGQPQ
ncbi:MAG: S-layer homology domain-containing protein [Peptoniphilus sp.]|nr:S-layer homology domain-containing protein [Peptoniphilus sp.]MDY3118363.1 S-layer homology domain-containing protein [Peptoniphilus sp.]